MENKKKFIIPEGVTKIGKGDFDGIEDAVSVVLPNGIVDINANAFENCKNLKSITIPDSVLDIGWDAFESCENITVTYKGQTFKYDELEMLYELINS